MDKSTRSKDAVTQRILETTLETERLKQELQNLISAGITEIVNLRKQPIVNAITSHKAGKNPNLLYPPEQTNILLNSHVENVGNKKSFGNPNVAALAKNKQSKSLQNLLQPPNPHYMPQKETSDLKSHKSTEDLSKETISSKDKNVVQSNMYQMETNNAIEPKKSHHSKSISQKSSESSSKQSVSKKKSSAQSHVTVRSEERPLSILDPKVDLVQQKPVESHLNVESPSKNKILVLSNITLKKPGEDPLQEKPQREKVLTPEWLKNTLGEGDPYNFINTVKRQLKYVVNENKPQCVDIGVQGNLTDIVSEQKSEKTNKKSDLKSFISHKCMNLDPSMLQHIDFNRKKQQLDFKDGATFTNSFLRSECDSDTSKNIPSISSESGTSLRRNAEFVKQSLTASDLKPLKNAPPNLDTKKVDEIKLQKSSKLSEEIATEMSSKHSLKVPSPEDIQRIKKKLFTESDSYSLDFIATDLSKSNSKSRDSLITFNCAKVSPNRIPLHLKPASDNIDHPSQNSSSSKLETDAISKNYSSKVSEKPAADSHRKSKSLTSISEGFSQKRDSRSAEFYSLYSELAPSGTDPELNTENVNVASLEISEPVSSEVVTEASEKSSRKFDDDFTEVLKPKNLFTGSDNFKNALENELSEKTRTVSSIKSSEKSTSNLHKSKSEQIIPFKRNTSVFSKSESNIYGNKENIEVLSLKEPKLSLNIREKSKKSVDSAAKQALMKNISLRSGDRTIGDMNNTNEIHLKFEAEIHLLNDFNQSLRHFSEIEKAFESLRSKNDSELVTKKVLQNRDTQTSVVTKTSTKTVSKRSDLSTSQISTINYSRGSGIDSEIHSELEDDSELSKVSSERWDSQRKCLDVSKKGKDGSETLLELTQGSELNVLESVNIEDTDLGNMSESSTSLVHLSQMDELSVGGRNLKNENHMIRNFAGMSLRMFDQLIKDEDARIENWKKIVKIREQALLDRTRGELVWLEMQKKQFIETGKLPEASMIKKKQRGILLKHQQEKHEMQRLKQMQKEASAKRKTLLKRERDLIKNQLLSNNMSTKLKSNRDRNERRLSGPLKVIQATGSVHSETSVSKGVGKVDQEIKSISSRTCSVVNITSAASDKFNSDLEPMELALVQCKQISTETISSMKKRLLMREHALAKRRKTVEELLQWHKKLLEEEKAIEDLESKVEKIISKIPSESNEEASFRQTKDLKAIPERSLSAPSMSQVALDRLLPPQENISSKSKNLSSKNIPQGENLSEDSNKAVSSANYSTDFDVESVPEVLPQNTDDQSSVSSISQLIENFSRIEGNILNLSLIQKKQSLDSEEKEVPTEKSESVSSAAEEMVQDEAKSDGFSISSQIPSEIEVKNREETPSEMIQTEGQHSAPEEDDKSILIVEEDSGEHLTVRSEENEAHSSVVKEELTEKDITKEESEDVVKSQAIISENDRTAKSESDNATKTPLINEDISSREEMGESVSDNEELKIEHVPDNSKTSLRTDLASISSAEQTINKLGDKKPESVSEIIEISSEDSSEEESPKTSGLPEEINLEIPEKSHTVPTENEQDASSLKTHKDVSEQLLEDVPQSSQILSIVEKNVSEKSSSVPEETKPSTSQRGSAEDEDLIRITEENIPSASQVSSSYPKSEKISAQISSEEVQTSPSKEDASTSRQVEEIVDQAVSNVDVTSTSPQIEEPGTSSQVVTLSKEDVASTLEESERQSHASHVVPSIAENIPVVVEEEMQSSENKTDEEKAASLSIRASGSQRGSASEDRSSSATVSRLETQEPSVNEAESMFSSEVSEDLHLGEVSEEGLTEVAIPEKSSTDIDNEDKNGESSARSLNKASSSSKTLSAEEKFAQFALTKENSLSTEDNLKLVTTKIDKSEPSSCRSSEVANEDLPSSGKIVLTEEAQSTASRVDDKTISSADKEKSTTSSIESTVISDKSSKSSKPTEGTEKSDRSTAKSSSVSEKSPKLALDVKKRVQEILSEASPVTRGGKSPRMQDLCVMTYDLISPSHSPESGSPLEERCKSFSLGSEAEELLRKQLAIEQEIKLLTEQQQKEQAQPFYIREIPNKPPPPYTPPSKSKAAKTPSIVPSSKEEVEQITEYSAKIIHKAYLSKNLDNISISDNTLNLIAKNIDKGCYKFVFDLCKEVAIEHYSQFVEEAGPSWLRLDKTQSLTPLKPLDMKGLKKLMNKKLLELFGFEKQEKKKENAIMKWSRKKRDHVDEVLVQEMQAQESSWNNFDRDELIVKDRITNEIMDMLLMETALVLKKAIQKKSDVQ